MSKRVAISHTRAAILISGLLFGFSSLATAQVSIGIGLPSVSIGINVPLYPNLVPVPGYPVYYDPRQHSNLFFYDGLYWVYSQDNWYTSSWYNGPWDLVYPEMVPDFVLRVPVRFYRHPPRYFFGWNREAPPRWGEHWGHDWDEHRHGWHHWDRASIPERAPLPRYQRQYSRGHYPSADEQRMLRDRNYRYQPHEEVARRHFEQAPGREHESRRPSDERQHSNAAPPGNSRQYSPAAERPPNGERRRAPSPPGRSTADGQHGQSDRRAPEERGRPNVERRDAPSPRSQPEHRDPQRVNPGAQQQQRRPAQEPSRQPPRQPSREPDRDSPQRSRSDKSQE